MVYPVTAEFLLFVELAFCRSEPAACRILQAGLRTGPDSGRRPGECSTILGERTVGKQKARREAVLVFPVSLVSSFLLTRKSWPALSPGGY